MFFQNSVIKKYLASMEAEKVNQAWEIYKAYFLNPAIQENIRASKEEQFQEGFLRELLVKVFGYTLNPTPDYNLITEQKNETDAKKADGAILRDGKVIGVIELKDHKTTDLSHVERQAFGYKSQHKDTKYVVISNFEKLRFYIDNAVEHIEWNLFTLTEEQFRLLYFCLAWTNIQTDKPLKAKAESVSNEDEVTQKLYRDYSAFKREIFADILANNTTEETPKEQILLLFKKTQKLLDRLLFIFFAEDGGLLPPNSMIEILNQWEQLKEMDEYVPLYSRIKKYFGYMNTGWQGKKYEIFAYNGGLFKPDEVLDGVKISDDVLARFTRKLADYDYSTDVDVNILGHIFENSLNEIEEVTAQINAGEAPSVSKRKRDGVFYTPQYITKYIVENTVGKLCAEKKAEMGIDEQEYFADKNRQMATKKRLLDQLTQYREWLLGITICDPACGSGAFLNAALQFLMAEHKLIDEMEAKLTGAQIVFPNVENSILENNLYGVDINEESVEIARLALWLRTAKPHRKLSSLNNNIKCGNSLISDPAIAGDKAFDWQAEFPQVFAKGGFDVVIGNPPYVLCQPSNTDEQTLNYYKTYEVASYKIDLFHLFFERGISILKEKGRMGYITPNTYLANTYIEELRKLLLKQKIETLTLHPNRVFADASVDVATITLQKEIDSSYNKVLIRKMRENAVITESFELEQTIWKNNTNCVFSIARQFNIDTKNCIDLGEIASVTFGLQTVDKSTYVQTEKIDDNWEPCYTGKDITRYNLAPASLYFLNKPEEVKAGGSWNMDIHHSQKIVVRQIGAPEPIFAFDSCGYATLNTMYSIVVNNEKYNQLYILAIINSSVIKKWWLSKYADNKELFPKVKGGHLKTIPIPECADQQPFIDLADKMLSLNKDLQSKRARFLRRLQDNMPTIKITGTLAEFDTLDFASFVAELKKQKIKLSLVQQDEWEEYFAQYKAACLELTSAIAATDAEIDSRVYALYGLTEEERKVVEGA